MSQGFVYILTNPSMPGIVKIGKTTRSVDQRALELYQTGVPTPFEVVSYVESPDCCELERQAHLEFRNSRVSESREFFSVSWERVHDSLQRLLLEQVRELVEIYTPDQTLVSSDLYVDEGDICALAHNMNAEAKEVVSAFYLIAPEEFRPALNRWRAKVEAGKKQRVLKAIES